jgi:hypothetical protein
MENDTTSGHNDLVVDGGGNANASESNADPLDKALVVVESLYTTRDTYFPRDPKEKTTSYAGASLTRSSEPARGGGKNRWTAPAHTFLNFFEKIVAPSFE